MYIVQLKGNKTAMLLNCNALEPGSPIISDRARRIAPVQAPSRAHYLSIGKHRCFRTFHFFALLPSCVLLIPRCYSDAQVVLFRGRGIQYFQNASNMVADVKAAR